jgi:type IV pilus assembly protein PilN
MRITINLATRPFADLGPTIKRLRIAMAVFAVVSIGLGIGLHLLHSKAEAVRARNHSLDGQIAGINTERHGYEAMMRQPDNAQVLDQAGNLNRVFDQKAFSWTLAMEDLETVLPGGVQVTTLEPIRDKEGDISLRLRVVGPRDKDLQLVQNLEHSRHFMKPRIAGESSESTGGPGERLEPVSASNKVNFDLLADYNPATLEEQATAPKKGEGKAKSDPNATGATRHAGAPGAHGPGLRRAPNTGVSQPPTGPQSPAALRQSGQHRYPVPAQQTSPPPRHQPIAKPGPGVPQ